MGFLPISPSRLSPREPAQVGGAASIFSIVGLRGGPDSQPGRAVTFRDVYASPMAWAPSPFLPDSADLGSTSFRLGSLVYPGYGYYSHRCPPARGGLFYAPRVLQLWFMRVRRNTRRYRPPIMPGLMIGFPRMCPPLPDIRWLDAPGAGDTLHGMRHALDTSHFNPAHDTDPT